MAGESETEPIREKRERAKVLLSAKLLDGLRSGKPIRFDDDCIPEKKRRLIAHTVKRKR